MPRPMNAVPGASQSNQRKNTAGPAEHAAVGVLNFLFLTGYSSGMNYQFAGHDLWPRCNLAQRWAVSC